MKKNYPLGFGPCVQHGSEADCHCMAGWGICKHGAVEVISQIWSVKNPGDLSALALILRILNTHLNGAVGKVRISWAFLTSMRI